MSDDERRPEIRIDRIPVGRGLGALVVIVALIAAMLAELEPLRWPVLLGVAGGVVLAGILVWWHRARR